MQPRRSLRLIAGALVLALPLLSSCGFGKATDRVYTPAEGVNDRDGVVKLLSAVVVAAQPGSGTFIATLSNSSSTDDAELSSLAGGGEDEGLTIDEVEPLQIAPRGYVNLADDGGIPVRGEFGAGDFVTLTLTFASGDTIEKDVPVVYACDEYTGLDFSAGDTPSEPPTPPSTEATDGSTPTESTESTESSESSEPSAEAGTGESYDCADVLEEE
jgi:hypothetical protein